MDNYVTMSVLFAITAKLDVFARSASIKCMEKENTYTQMEEYILAYLRKAIFL